MCNFENGILTAIRGRTKLFSDSSTTIPEYSRLHQMAKIFLFAPSSGLYSCPLAMTDGAAKTLEGLKQGALESNAFSRLTSRNPETFWTSGQWMTERKGGSDVASGTQTIAVPHPSGGKGWYRLYGYKWFSSATDSDMALTLAHTFEPSHDNKLQGSLGLSMFYLETKNKDGELNGLEVVKLKNKLGTRQLPTAELLLDGTVAKKVSDEGRGIRSISSMLNITRIHNALTSASYMRRVLSLARDYATKRIAFGRKLCDHPLHMKTLASLEVETRGCELLAFEVCRLLGCEDIGVANDKERQLLRLLTPIAKLYTAKQSVSVVSEGLEAFGGQGYIEDTGLPGLLRDTQVTSIWEGTTNVLSLDVLRAASKSKEGLFHALADNVTTKLEAALSARSELSKPATQVRNALACLQKFIKGRELQDLEVVARDLAFGIASIYIGALLVEHASYTADQMDIAVTSRWNSRHPLLFTDLDHEYSKSAINDDCRIVMDHYV